MLTVHELVHIADSITPVAGLIPTTISKDDEESCMNFIISYMQSDTLLKLEDEGFAQLLTLRDLINELIESRVNNTVSDPSVLLKMNLMHIHTHRHPLYTDTQILLSHSHTHS